MKWLSQAYLAPTLGALLGAAALGLGGCDAMSVAALHQELGGDDPNDPDAQTLNGLSLDALTGNALLANVTARELMVTLPLTTTTYASGYLSEQLADPFAREAMQYLAYCALPLGASVRFAQPEATIDETWHGRLGLCPAWGAKGGSADAACQERVSACLLALQNAYDATVPVSLRGKVDLTPLPLGSQLRGAKLPEVASWQPCIDANTIEIGDATRDCGWEVEWVGVCQSDGVVTADTNLGTDDVMMRVCDGPSGCDSWQWQVKPLTEVNPGSSSFDCIAGKSFTVMLAAADPADQDAVAAAQLSLTGDVLYPAPESKVFTWQEGGFYGTIFGNRTNGLTVEVDSTQGEIVYTYYRKSYRYSLSLSRTHSHDHFMTTSGFNGTVYPQMFSCWAPKWSMPEAYSHNRVCAGPAGSAYCAATPTGACGPVTQTDAMCQSFDGSGGDYDDCSDNTGAPVVWNHGFTTYLHDWCSVVPETCAPATM